MQDLASEFSKIFRGDTRTRTAGRGDPSRTQHTMITTCCRFTPRIYIWFIFDYYFKHHL